MRLFNKQYLEGSAFDRRKDSALAVKAVIGGIRAARNGVMRNVLVRIRRDGSAKRRDLRHAPRYLERSLYFAPLLSRGRKSAESRGPRDCGPLVGLGRRPVSEAHAVEPELKGYWKHCCKIPNLTKISFFSMSQTLPLTSTKTRRLPNKQVPANNCVFPAKKDVE